MIVKPTPHIEVTDTNQIAKTVLMPGDPLRAEYIANTYLTDVVKFNNVRGMYGFTGNYKGRRISVMGSGMGMPSIGIYSYELYNNYGVEQIVRIGSAGAYSPELDLYDVIIVKDAYSESSYALTQCGNKATVLEGTKELSDKLMNIAADLGIKAHYERIHSSDVFYRQGGTDYKMFYNELGCAAVEMESFALFNNAQVLGKKAACVLTISDSFCKEAVTSSEERQTSFNQMMLIALELAE